MKRMLLSVFVGTGLMLSTALPAAARDVCLFDGGTHLVFKKVKTLSAAPGRVIPFSGFALGLTPPFPSPPFSCPLEGSAMRTSTGAVRVGTSFYCGNEPGLGYRNGMNSGTTDDTFAGTYRFDLDGDGVAESSTVYSVVDCSTITIIP